MVILAKNRLGNPKLQFVKAYGSGILIVINLIRGRCSSQEVCSAVNSPRNFGWSIITTYIVRKWFFYCHARNTPDFDEIKGS